MGGVGKSTLAVISAYGLARRNPDVEVILVDLDLTGASVGQGMPLRATRWDGRPHGSFPPTGHCTEDETRTLQEKVDFSTFLLWPEKDWPDEREFDIRSILWKVVNAPANLRIITARPSAAHWGLTEEVLTRKIEDLIVGVSSPYQKKILIFDCPSGIGGLSGIVLSFCQNLGHPRQDSSQAHPKLREIDVFWSPVLVVTSTTQEWRHFQEIWDRLGKVAGLRMVHNRVTGGPVWWPSTLGAFSLGEHPNMSLFGMGWASPDPRLGAGLLDYIWPDRFNR